jgi:hypothetical protein
MFEIPLYLNQMKATRAMRACQQPTTYENFETINSNMVDRTSLDVIAMDTKYVRSNNSKCHTREYCNAF